MSLAARERLVRLGRSLTVMALAAAAFGAALPTSHADCASPTLRSSRFEVHADESFSVKGRNWPSSCVDAETCSVGCLGSQCSDGEPVPPAQDISLVLRPAEGGDESEGLMLANGIDADPDTFSFSLQISIPGFIKPGRYLIYGEYGVNDSSLTRPSEPIILLGR